MDQDLDVEAGWERDTAEMRDTTHALALALAQPQAVPQAHAEPYDGTDARHNLDSHSYEYDHHRPPVLDRLDHIDHLGHHDSHDPPDLPNLAFSPSPGHQQTLAATSHVQQHAIASVDPDDFYKSYRVLPVDSTPDTLPMAASSVSRPSLRSNADGSTPRHPVVPASRSLPRPNATTRSVSSPVDQRLLASAPRSSPSGKPSVKDLKKRFDQTSADASSAVPRPLVRPRAITRTRQEQSSTSHEGSGLAPCASLRSSLTDDSTVPPSDASSNHSLPKPNPVAQEQLPNNSHSFASRIGKPRSSANGDTMASQTLPYMSQRSFGHPEPPPPVPPVPAIMPRAHGLLFGEILPEYRDAAAAGHGIEVIRPRRTSESSIHNIGFRQRSFSDVDAEPSSPSSWYRIAGKSQDASQDTSTRPNHHTRSQSDVTISISPSPVARKTRPPTSPLPSVSNQPPSSRLPRSIRKFPSPAASASPSSTRSNSPTSARQSLAPGRTSRGSPPTSRAKTPTSQSKASTPASKVRKPPPQAISTSASSSSRLQAYVGSALPKTSPPLRSSRPRQPVSVASTASSRMKEVGRGKSPHRSNAKLPPHSNESTPRRRKISVGPIDFEQRREHIRLAYSKSLREKEALDARQQAAERRRRQAEASAKDKTFAKSSLAISNPASPTTVVDEKPSHQPLDAPEDLHPKNGPEDMPVEQVSRAPDKPMDDSAVERTVPILFISTTSAPGLDAVQPSNNTAEADSPTLGLPGSFPALSPPMDQFDEPHSAISATSATTEFDTEPQTNPPVQATSTADIPATTIKPPSPNARLPASQRSEYQYPFQDGFDSPKPGSIHQEATFQSNYQLPLRSYGEEPPAPEAFAEEHSEQHDFRHHAHSTSDATVTVLPPPVEEELRPQRTEETPFPRMPAYDESECPSEPEGGSGFGQHHEGGIADTFTDVTDDNDREQYRRSYSQFGDQQSSHRASTCASTDAGDVDDLYYATHSRGFVADGSNGLTVPSFRSVNDRLSRQSAWTDFSVDSTDQSDVSRSPALHNYDTPSIDHHTAMFKSRLNGETSDNPVRKGYYSGSDLRDMTDSNRSSAQFSHPQLPEVDIGGGFSIPYLSPGASASLSYLPSPDREPPPVPASVSGSALNSRTSSVLYEQSQYESTLVNSGRGSDDYLPHMETPLSMDSTSIGTNDQYFATGMQTPADSDAKSLAPDNDAPIGKERHRLAQRRNVIKELVDTEAVFVRDMNIVEEIYKGTAEACPKLDDQTVKLIFRNSHEIIEFHTSFLAQIKAAVAAVYIPKGGRSPKSKEDSIMTDGGHTTAKDIDDTKDRTTLVGPVFQENMERMKVVHEGFLRNSDHAAKRLIQIQQDSTVKVWLNECNEVAKDLTAAWDLDSLLIKPMQRITKYPNLIITLLQHTPQDHPDREALTMAKDTLETAIIEINRTKKNFELVGQIVGRKRKESDVKAGFARAFGKRVDKLQAPTNRPPEEPAYAKINEKFGDDYLRLQVVLRDVEFYTRQVSAYVHEFLQYMSSIELVMRLQPGNYPELESKWVQFNISVRDLEKVALEEHLSQVRKRVIEPFESVIKAYGNPSLAMKKRQKRRLDFERYEQLKKAGKTIDPKLQELVDQYEALNDTLKKELPQLSSLTEKVGNICLANFVNIQVKWYAIWKEKMKTVLGDCPDTPDLKEIVATFQRDYPYAQEQLATIGILNPAYRGRQSQSTTASIDEGLLKSRSRPSDAESRGRRLSMNADSTPSLPTPDFANSSSGSFTASPSGSGTESASGTGNVPSPYQYYYRDYYSGIRTYSTHSASGKSPDLTGSGSRSGTGQTSTRPSTGRSFESSALQRQSSESATQYQRDSNTTYNSNYNSQEPQRYSNLFHSALPLSDGPEENRESSRASSRERSNVVNGYNVLWLAASLFEFNIATTKHEAGYPYLTYQAGEIFDVIAEKGELWLAKNQDDSNDQVGWIWSKHFAKLADS